MKAVFLLTAAVTPALLASCQSSGPVYVISNHSEFLEQPGGDRQVRRLPPRSARPRPEAGNRGPLRHADPLELRDRPPPPEARPVLPVPGSGATEESMTAGAGGMQADARMLHS